MSSPREDPPADDNPTRRVSASAPGGSRRIPLAISEPLAASESSPEPGWRPVWQQAYTDAGHWILQVYRNKSAKPWFTLQDIYIGLLDKKRLEGATDELTAYVFNQYEYEVRVTDPVYQANRQRLAAGVVSADDVARSQREEGSAVEGVPGVVRGAMSHRCLGLGGVPREHTYQWRPDGDQWVARMGDGAYMALLWDLRKRGQVLSFYVLDMLADGLLHGQNVLVAGGTGSGKTTLLNALVALFPAEARIIVIEDTMEVRVDQLNTLRFEARGLADLDVENPPTIRDLVKHSLRHRPDHIVVGEIRGPEAHDVLQALNTGHGGSLTTIHANSASDALFRIASCAYQAEDRHP